MTLLDGIKVKKELLNELKNKIDTKNIKPSLAVIQIGNDSASNIYIKNKEKTAINLGCKFEHIKFKEDCKNSLEFFTIRLNNYGIDYKQYECGNAIKLNCKIISIEKEHVFIKVKGVFTLAIPLSDIEKMEEYEDEN